MRIFVLAIGFSALLPGVSLASNSYATQCARGEDARSIAVVSPGLVGQKCDVRYVQSGDARVPYHADNSNDFCEAKARELVAELTKAGFACVAESSVASAPVSDSTSDYTVEVRSIPATSSGATVNEAQNAEAGASTPAEAVEVAQNAAPSVVLEVPPVGEAQQIETSPIQEERGELNVLPETKIADASPTTSPGLPATLFDQNAPNPQSSTGSVDTRRITGAAPAPTITLAENARTQSGAAAVSVTMASAAQDSVTPTRNSALRSTSDVINATLQAQAAAWNEGDLNAFMDIYWKDSNLKFVSGSKVTKGWNATMRRYRDNYESEGGLGVLSLQDIDVETVTDDVAIATGRFNLVQSDTASSGTFSLVLRQINGAWRIVHDHTNSDAGPSAQ